MFVARDHSTWWPGPQYRQSGPTAGPAERPRQVSGSKRGRGGEYGRVATSVQGSQSGPAAAHKNLVPMKCRDCWADGSNLTQRNFIQCVPCSWTSLIKGLETRHCLLGDIRLCYQVRHQDIFLALAPPGWNSGYQDHSFPPNCWQLTDWHHQP